MAMRENSSLDKFLGSREFLENSYPKLIYRDIQASLSAESRETLKPSTSDYLVGFLTKSQNYCVGCVDIVNSTKISASMPYKNLSGYYEIFLNSMSKIIGRFGGKVIKNVGDCLLYYFPKSVDLSKSDGYTSCLDCGLAMIEARQVICQQLALKKLPCISYRISADCGRVLVMNTTESTSIDLIGPPLNMCTKINHCADHNEFVIGGDLYEMVKKTTGYRFSQVPSCNVGFKQSYPVYKVNHTLL